MTRESGKPAGFLVAMWIAALALSLSSAPAIESWLVHDRALGGRPVTLRVASALVDASERLGAGAVMTAADRLVARAKPDVVWLRARRSPILAEGPPTAAPVARAPSTAAGDRGRAPLLDARASSTRILIIGASSMQLHFGAEIERALRASYRGVSVERFGKLATGLVRPDYFDWQKKTRELLDKRPRDLVIAQFGGNDAQPITARGHAPLAFASPEWDAELGRRVSALVSLVRSRGARFVMLGMPMMKNPRFSRRIEHVNGVIRASVEASGGSYLPLWELSGQGGAYSNAIELDGAAELLRQSDGVHFTRPGAIYMARKTSELLERELLLLPTDPKLALVVRREIDSRALGRPVHYLAYVPEPAARGAGDLPVLFLLHGADGSYRDWSDHAQRTLQALAVTHGLVIVTPEGGARGWYVDSALVERSDHASHIVDEVVRDVEAHLPVTDARGVAGVSAGGHGALTLALRNPGLFSAASSMSGVVDLTAAKSREALIERLGPYVGNEERWEERSARHLVREHPDLARALPMLLTVGASDLWAPANRSFAAELRALGLGEFEQYEGGHDWPTFTRQLPRHVAWHARELRAPGVSAAPPTR